MLVVAVRLAVTKSEHLISYPSLGYSSTYIRLVARSPQLSIVKNRACDIPVFLFLLMTLQEKLKYTHTFLVP